MSTRVAVLFGRGDAAPVDADGMDALNKRGHHLLSALQSIGYSNAELGVTWLPFREPDVDGCWWYWRDEMSLKIALKGCCLQTTIAWRSFLENQGVRNACLELVREIASCFGANTAIFAPDSSKSFNSGCSQLQEGSSIPTIATLMSNDEPGIEIITW